jgi:hypothetical protein
VRRPAAAEGDDDGAAAAAAGLARQKAKGRRQKEGQHEGLEGHERNLLRDFVPFVFAF